MRKAFIEALTELARKDPKVMCVIGDTGYSVFEEFENEFKERFVNAGIAEQNFVSFGAGLAAMGMKPFIYNVVSFMTYRAFEQIELDICYQENPVVIVGVGGGHAYGTAGPTHHAYFDIGMLTLLPHMTVICPADPIEMKAAVYAAYEYGKPVYIRIGRNTDPVIYKGPIPFRIGKAIPIREGKEAVIFATGTMVKDAIEACGILEQNGFSVSLYSMHTIKPIDRETVLECTGKFPLIFTLEEHGKRGGLGDAIGAVMLEEGSGCCTRLIKFGFPDEFAPVTGTREYLNEQYQMDAAGVAGRVRAEIEGIRNGCSNETI